MRFLEEKYDVHSWFGRRLKRSRLRHAIGINGGEISGGTLLRANKVEREEVSAIKSIWQFGGDSDRLLSVEIYISPSVKAAHDCILSTLATFQSGEVARRTEKDSPGDVAFSLRDTMMLFARDNFVVFVRNAGQKLVPVHTIALQLDSMLQRSPASSSADEVQVASAPNVRHSRPARRHLKAREMHRSQQRLRK